MSVFRILAALACGFAVTAQADDDDDPQFRRGRTVYNLCRGCHTIAPGQASLMKGPSLFGIINRKAGTLPGYADYSDALTKSGLTWTPDVLDKYLTSPAKFIPGNKMAFLGVGKPTDRSAVIAYLTKASAAPAIQAQAAAGEPVLMLKRAQ
jgi:cytochrome c2